jgi:signal transduction histidine kinase
VIVAVIALYGDWVPFLLAIVYVALDHGVIGSLFPELVYNHPDGIANPWKWALIHAVLVLGESAALLMGWKVAEQARRRTSLVLNSAGEGIVGTDLDGRVTFANPAAAGLTQYGVNDLQGRRLDELVRPAEGANASVLRRDGTLLPVEWQSTPIRANDVVVGAVVTLKDIRERLRSEEELRSSLEREKLLVDIVSHDVKNQISVCVPRLELLAMRHPELAQQIELAMEPVTKGVSIIDDALCLLRIEQDAADQPPVPLAALLDDVTADLFPVASGKGIQLVTRVPVGSDASVDPLLQRAIHNVVANAIKWSPANAEVEIGVEGNANGLSIFVVDHGPGISDANKPLLFERFERLETGSISGHGLGLAIARRIVERERGRIYVRDTPGGGATFVLELPGSPHDAEDLP